jgi:serine protease inhibitor
MLALDLLDRLDGDGDVVLSPYGVQRALEVVRKGATGRTREALDAVLGPEETPALELEDPAVILELATAAWLADGYAPGPALTLETGPLDVGRVNAWAKERTHGMIPHVVDRFAEDEKLAITDAVYLDAAWTEPFDPADTQMKPFDGAGEVPMMRASGEFAYAEQDGLRAVRLPYGDTLALDFVAVLADSGEPPAAGWRELQFRRRQGTVELPRFSAQYKAELVEPLKALGLGPAFIPGGDLENLFTGPEPLKALGRILQRARADVDERGTRAAAVTVVTAVAVSAVMDPPPPFHLIFDRPFLWAVEHRATGIPLFVGRVRQPREKGD